MMLSRDWIFVRHGQTDWNAEGRIQGQTDIPLNERGRAQARANGERLAKVPGAKALPFFVSPLGRSQETARLVRAAMGLDPEGFETVDDLRELSFGEWEGRTLVDVWHDDPDPVESRKHDKWNYVPPGGESYAQLLARVVPVLEALPHEAIIVSHGGTMRTVVRHLTNLPEGKAAIEEIFQDRIWRWNGESGGWA